jgi:NADH dehydrogenase FAD-containing subunit
MTANDCTHGDSENVTEGIDYERLGRETAARELERHEVRLRSRLSEAVAKVEEDELSQEDVAEIQKELANAQVWVARVAAGEYLSAHEVLGDE